MNIIIHYSFKRRKENIYINVFRTIKASECNYRTYNCNYKFMDSLY